MNSKSSKTAAARIMGLILVVALSMLAVTPAYASAGGVSVQSVNVGGPTGSVTYGTAGDVSYPVEVLCTGTGGGNTFVLTVPTAWPAGVTADFSPSSSVVFNNGCSGTAIVNRTLNVHTTSATPGGVASFTVAVGGKTSNGSLTVHGIALTVQGMVVDNKIYNGNANASISNYGSLSTGVVWPDVVSLDHSSAGAVFSDKFVGTGKTVTGFGYALTGAQASNYTLATPTTFADISKAPLHIYIDASAADKVYDGNTNAVVTFSTDKVAGDDVTASGTGVFDTRNVGANKTVSAFGVSLSGASAGNYNVDLSTGTGLADITARPLTVTAGTQTKQYDGTVSSSVTPGITSGVLQASDTAGFSQSFDSASAGTGKVLTPAGAVSDGNGGANYHVTFVPVSTGVIDARPITVTADAHSKVYGNSDPALTYGVTGSLVAPDSFSGALARDAGEAVGSYAITQGDLALSSNYNLSFTGANLAVTARPITTVTADSKSIAFGQADPDFTFTYAAGDVVSGDTIQTPPTCGVSGDHSAAGLYDIVCSGGSSANYDFSATNYVSGTLTRSASPIVSVQYPSVGAHDGWILESGQNTKVGGKMNSAGLALRVGDDALNKQYKSILSFDTSALPKTGITITDVTLKVKLQKTVGSTRLFKSLQGLYVDINNPFIGRNIGLELRDFRVKPTVSTGMMAAGSLLTNTPDGSGWYSITLNPSAFQFVNVNGETQLRLRFLKNNNNNAIANYLSLFSGDSANAPQLSITYSIP